MIFLKFVETIISNATEQRDVEIKSKRSIYTSKGRKRKNINACYALDITNLQRWLWEIKREPRASKNVQAELVNG